MRDGNQHESTSVSRILSKNVLYIEQKLEKSVDFVKREVILHGKEDSNAVFFCTDGLVSVPILEKTIETFIYKADELAHRNAFDDMPIELLVQKHLLTNVSFTLNDDLEKGIHALLSGDTYLLIDGSTKAFVIPTRGWDARSIDEPQTEQVVRGPRDGFTENLRTNTALVRRRIRDPELRIDAMNVGKRTKTDINIAYIKGIVKNGLVEEVKKRIGRIEIDGVLESGYIEELIEDAPLSPFTTIMSTERPDKVAAALLEGRVAIFVDNTPFVLIAPTSFWQFLQASDDYYTRYMAGSFFRIIRHFAFLISLTLTSIYVMLVSFHQEMIPTPLALSIASGREVVPLPVLIEALMMDLVFELMREAGLRMPKPVGQAVSIVGSLVIGQAAVQAGIVSPFMVIIVAITGIASFAIPNYGASFSIRIIRFPLLIASGTMGLLGFASMFTVLVIHALTLRSFGESYLAPATPFQPSDQKDALIRFPWWKMNKRPQVADGDNERVGEDQVPKPPKK
jgi:spore germination protein KA